MPTTTFSTREAIELAEVTYRQADYWDRNNILSPAIHGQGSGFRRRYTVRDVQVLWALGQLGPDPRIAPVLCNAPSLDGWVVISLHSVAVAHDRDELVDLLSVVGPVQVLDLRDRPLINGDSSPTVLVAHP